MARPILETPFGPLMLVEVYDEFDGPRLFSVISTTGQLFLALWYDQPEPGVNEWLLAPVSPERLGNIRSGSVDLHDTYLEAEGGSLYLLRSVQGAMASFRDIGCTELDPSRLPDPGDRLEVEGELLGVLAHLHATPPPPLQEAAE